MSTLAPALALDPRARPRPAARAAGRFELPLRLVAFAALCLLLLPHYALLVQPAATGRAAAVTAVAAAAAAALALSARVSLPRAATLALRLAIALAALALALAATRLRAPAARPGDWGRSADG